MYFKVHLFPESRNEYVKEMTHDTLAVAVRERAEQGQANRRMLQLLSAHFGAGKRIRVISGHHSPHKIVSVD